MTKTQFIKSIAKAKCGGGRRVDMACRDILVNNLSVSEAAKRNGVSENPVIKNVEKIRSAFESMTWESGTSKKRGFIGE